MPYVGRSREYRYVGHKRDSFALHENPDFDLGLYRYQDATLERDPKHMENRAVGQRLENAGDIVRELTGRRFADGNYIGQKVHGIEKELQNPRELLEPLSKEDKERAQRLKEGYLSMPLKSDRSKAARDVVVGLADQDVGSTLGALNRFKALETKETSS